MVYAMVALAALAVLCAWLIWRCVTLRAARNKLHARCRELQQDRAIRQNLQQLVARREEEIHRLRRRISDYEEDFREMESRASDLNLELFQESGRRILAEKEDGARRLQLQQLEKQVEDSRRKLREQQAEAAETVRRMQDLIASQEKEIARLRQANARRIKRNPADSALENQITLDELLENDGNP